MVILQLQLPPGLAQPLGRLLNQRWGRWLAITVTLSVWTSVIGTSYDMSLMFGVLLWPFLWIVACKVYVRMLDNRRTHVLFWARFLGFLAISWSCYAFMGYANGVFFTAVAAFIIERNTAQDEAAIQTRGAEESTVTEAQIHYNSIRPKTDDGILFGGSEVPTKEAIQHFAYIGMSGSGKTISIRLFMQDVLPGIGQSYCRKRAVIYDPKHEMYTILQGIGIQEKDIIFLDPFDQRCRPWHMALDMETAVDAEALANILVPEKPGAKANDEFWRNTTIICIKSVVRYLNRTAGHQWRFRDLLLALRSKTIISRMMNDDPRLQHCQQTFGSDNTADNIMSTLIVSVERFDPIAACWHKAETVYGNKPFSLCEFLTESKVLLLPYSETAKTQVRELNRVIITRLGQLVIEKPETLEPQTFFITDELSSMGNMEMLISMAEQCRSKGLSLCVAFQSRSHIEYNFSEKLADAFLGQFTHIAALKLQEETTAKWISGIVGRRYGIRFTESKTTSWNSDPSYTVSSQYFDELVVDPSELMAIPAAFSQKGFGFQGFYIGHKKWWATYPAAILQSLAPKVNEGRRLLPMPKAYQEIELWTAFDYKRLGIAHITDLNSGVTHPGLDDDDESTSGGFPVTR